MCPLEKYMANFVSILALRPHEQYEKKKARTLKDELPKSVGAKYATGDQWRTNSRKIEETNPKPKQKQHPAVDVTGDGTKVQCCKEQYCIGTWNVRSTNQGKLEQRAAERRYPTSKVMSCGREEIPHVQGKRNRSKMAGAGRGHQRADRLKAQSQQSSQSDHLDHSLV